VAVHVPRFTEDIVAEITLQARSSPDVNQTSGVSVRMSIANHETLVANALRRALRCGEPEAVPRISDLDALVQATAGKLELEYAGEARSDAEVVRELIKRATRIVFDAWVPVEAVAPVAEAFQQGWVVEVSSAQPSSGYLQGLEEIKGLREVAARLAGGDSPARIAAGIEFVLEGLHLRNRLNKTTSEGGSRYARA
jgi:magnesium chelatase subunit I